ncbi:hypothetical protein EVJ58_g8704 [Rhodofomes roseus]|uniref:Uncharacterized protein n=1 Tax=Rhodofomes roseus TaxID=34475 RepID=A0A4Y9XX62_9APHY|nr:hypothetical protein EVJ58_g8704 [Rhodofomes roseus]
MFGCCVAGRLMQTNLQQIDETHAMFELPNASTINHISCADAVNAPFADQYHSQKAMHALLPRLSNDKPSAIFRLRGTFSSQTTKFALFANGAPGMFDPAAPADVTAILGIAIEPLSTIEAEMAALPNAVARPANAQPDATLLAERIVKHLFNYVSGFMGGGPVTPESFVPMAMIAKWYEVFIGKVRNTGIGFLEHQE